MDKREIPLGKKFCGVSMQELNHYIEIESQIEDFLDLPRLIIELQKRYFFSGKERHNQLEELWFVPLLDGFHFPSSRIEKWFFVKLLLDGSNQIKCEVSLTNREAVQTVYSSCPKNFIALSKPTYEEASHEGKIV